jgi:DNA topoisomerase-1
MSESTNAPGLDAERAARAAGLRYVLDDSPGITRKRRGKGWSYYDPRGRLVEDAGERDRLKRAGDPPRLDRCLDQPMAGRPPAGHRPGLRRPEAVPVPSRLAGDPR